MLSDQAAAGVWSAMGKTGTSTNAPVILTSLAASCCLAGSSGRLKGSPGFTLPGIQVTQTRTRSVAATNHMVPTGRSSLLCAVVALPDSRLPSAACESSKMASSVPRRSSLHVSSAIRTARSSVCVLR